MADDVKSKLPTDWAFGAGHVSPSGNVLIPACESGCEPNNAGLLFHRTPSDETWHTYEVPLIVTRLAPAPIGGAGFGLCPYGAALQIGSGQSSVEMIRESDRPGAIGDLLDIRKIGNHVYACGMSRQVYRREATSWVPCDDDVLDKENGRVGVSGFKAMDGQDEDNIFAVGYGGEIWEMKAGRWKWLSSPTKLTINDVLALSAREAWACGQGGLLLKGDSERWEAVNHNGPSTNLWDVEWYRDHIYVTSSDALYRLEGQRLTLIDIRLDGRKPFGHLDTNGEQLWLFGSTDVAWTRDGNIWKDATP